MFMQLFKYSFQTVHFVASVSMCQVVTDKSLVCPVWLSKSTPHDDVIKWKHFQRYRPFVWGIHRSLVNTPPKGQWRGALTVSLICTQINGWANNGEAGDLRCHCAHYDGTIMSLLSGKCRESAIDTGSYIMQTSLQRIWDINNSVKCYFFITKHYSN